MRNKSEQEIENTVRFLSYNFSTFFEYNTKVKPTAREC